MTALLPRLVSDSAARVPDRPAAVMEGKHLTYAALEAAANRFARSLHAHGVRRGDRVALWLPKSPEAVVALYGIMKAGAAYVPIDPGAPPARMAFIARDCGVTGLVTRSDRALQLHGGYGYMKEYPIEREVRDALSGTLYSGTSEMQRKIIARCLGL